MLQCFVLLNNLKSDGAEDILSAGRESVICILRDAVPLTCPIQGLMLMMSLRGAMFLPRLIERVQAAAQRPRENWPANECHYSLTVFFAASSARRVFSSFSIDSLAATASSATLTASISGSCTPVRIMWLSWISIFESLTLGERSRRDAY